MKAKFVLFAIMFAVLLPVPHAFAQQPAVPSGTPSQATKDKEANVHQLSNRVEKLIKEVEDSTVACETRNGIVRRLRLLDDALRSGRRSAARSMVLAWRQNAWNLQAGRVIGPELGSSLQSQLGDMVDEIGYGWPDKPGPTKHWKPLPSCESSAGVLASTPGAVVGSYNPTATDPSADVKIFLDMALSLVPEVGGIMSGLVNLIWPQGPDSDANMFQAVAKAQYDAVKSDVQKFGYALMGDPNNPQTGSWNSELQAFYDFCDANGGRDSYACVNAARETLWNQWNSLNGAIVLTYAPDFLKLDDEAGAGVNYLPLYAQFQNLYMTFLRDGILLHFKYWGDRTDLDKSWTPIDLNTPLTSMDQQLDPTIKGYGVGYINDVYNAGADLASGNWATRNAYIRSMTLNVLDYRDTWKFMDPRRYPDPVPGGVKLTRMIYSDPAGDIPSSPHFPSNVLGPLKETSVWTTNYNPAPFVNYLVIDAVQATSPPLLGPAQSGAVTGDTTQPANHAHYDNLAALGPIIEVEAQIEPHFYSNSTQMQGYFPRWIGFDYAAGTSAQTAAGNKDSGLSACTFPLQFGCYTAIKYDGEVLATAQSGGEAFGESQGVVFGFRFADSFSPAGEAIGVDSGKCIDLPASGTQVVINGCQQPPKPAQIWTYDRNLQQISVTIPAEWSKTDPTNSGKHCLDAPDGSAVVISACDDGALTYDANGKPVASSSQRWTIDAVGDGIGKITNVKSGGLVVTASSAADGAGLSLASYVGHPTQQWHAANPSTGEIHGVGSGRCLDVPGASTAVGTQVQIYDCNGGNAQQWTYDSASKELIYAKASLCLQARGGATSSGTAVEINTCTGASEQQWTLQELSFSINQGGGGTITNVKSGLVMDVTGGSTANNTLVQLYKSNSTEGQQWSRTSSQGGALHAVGAGKCLTVPQWTAGTKPVIQTCATPLSATQIWTYHPIAQTFTVTGPSGTMCLYGYGYSASIETCSGHVYQRWALDFGNQTITNLYNGLVLDVAGGGTADGTEVLIYNYGGGSNQQWVWPLY